MGLTDQALRRGDARAACGGLRDWTGLYKRDYDLATPESMAHPAKASWDLAFKILAHLEELGLLHEGDCVLDPMAGIGRFNLTACAQGYRSIGVELEPKFVQMCQDNKAHASRKLCLPGFELPWEIVQGDARHLSGLLKERGLVSVTSPPYGDMSSNTKDSPATKFQVAHYGESRKYRIGPNNSKLKQGDYGNTPGQIGALPDKPLKAILSPPFGDMNHPTNYLGKQKRESCQEYSDNPANIGNLKDVPLAGRKEKGASG